MTSPDILCTLCRGCGRSPSLGCVCYDGPIWDEVRLVSVGAYDRAVEDMTYEECLGELFPPGFAGFPPSYTE